MTLFAKQWKCLLCIAWWLPWASPTKVVFRHFAMASMVEQKVLLASTQMVLMMPPAATMIRVRVSQGWWVEQHHDVFF